jgi:hypothetical protein
MSTVAPDTTLEGRRSTAVSTVASEGYLSYITPDTPGGAVGLAVAGTGVSAALPTVLGAAGTAAGAVGKRVGDVMTSPSVGAAALISEALGEGGAQRSVGTSLLHGGPTLAVPVEVVYDAATKTPGAVYNTVGEWVKEGETYNDREIRAGVVAAGATTALVAAVTAAEAASAAVASGALTATPIIGWGGVGATVTFATDAAVGWTAAASGAQFAAGQIVQHWARDELGRMVLTHVGHSHFNLLLSSQSAIGGASPAAAVGAGTGAAVTIGTVLAVAATVLAIAYTIKLAVDAYNASVEFHSFDAHKQAVLRIVAEKQTFSWIWVPTVINEPSWNEIMVVSMENRMTPEETVAYIRRHQQYVNDALRTRRAGLHGKVPTDVIEAMKNRILAEVRSDGRAKLIPVRNRGGPPGSPDIDANEALNIYAALRAAGKIDQDALVRAAEMAAQGNTAGAAAAAARAVSFVPINLLQGMVHDLRTRGGSVETDLGLCANRLGIDQREMVRKGLQYRKGYERCLVPSLIPAATAESAAMAAKNAAARAEAEAADRRMRELQENLRRAEEEVGKARKIAEAAVRDLNNIRAQMALHAARGEELGLALRAAGEAEVNAHQAAARATARAQRIAFLQGQGERSVAGAEADAHQAAARAAALQLIADFKQGMAERGAAEARADTNQAAARAAAREQRIAHVQGMAERAAAEATTAAEANAIRAEARAMIEDIKQGMAERDKALFNVNANSAAARTAARELKAAFKQGMSERDAAEIEADIHAAVARGDAEKAVAAFRKGLEDRGDGLSQRAAAEITAEIHAAVERNDARGLIAAFRKTQVEREATDAVTGVVAFEGRVMTYEKAADFKIRRDAVLAALIEGISTAEPDTLNRIVIRKAILGFLGLKNKHLDSLMQAALATIETTAGQNAARIGIMAFRNLHAAMAGRVAMAAIEELNTEEERTAVTEIINQFTIVQARIVERAAEEASEAGKIAAAAIAAFRADLDRLDTPSAGELNREATQSNAEVQLPEEAVELTPPTLTGRATLRPTLGPTVTLAPTLTATATLRPTLTATATLRPTLRPTVTLAPTLRPTATLAPTSVHRDPNGLDYCDIGRDGRPPPGAGSLLCEWATPPPPNLWSYRTLYFEDLADKLANDAIFKLATLLRQLLLAAPETSASEAAAPEAALLTQEEEAALIAAISKKKKLIGALKIVYSPEGEEMKKRLESTLAELTAKLEEYHKSSPAAAAPVAAAPAAVGATAVGRVLGTGEVVLNSWIAQRAAAEKAAQEKLAAEAAATSAYFAATAPAPTPGVYQEPQRVGVGRRGGGRKTIKRTARKTTKTRRFNGSRRTRQSRR